MSNKILIKRGSGAPTTSDLDNYEIAYDTGANKLYIRDGSDIIPFAAIVDEDNFASDDANRVPSQQSTKAYIASELAAAGAGDITAVVAGTGLSGGATSGSATLNVSGLTVSELAANSLTTSSESFADNDTTLMTSAAINDRITSFNYLTAHPNISAASSSDNSGRTYIQDITVDSNGHVTGIATATETVTDTNTVTTNIAGTGVSVSSGTGNSTISINFKDEDNMSSNSASHAATQQSIKAYVDAEVAGIVDSAPSALNTLDELAAALGDDANFATTTSTSLGNRLRVDTASQGLTGTQQANAITNLGITATKAELNYVDGVTSAIQTQLDGKQASGSYLTSVPNHSGDLITSGTVAAARIADLAASKITSGELATARVNWDSTDKTVRWDNGRGYHGNPRSVSMGYSGGNYGQLGYNIEFTTTSGEHTASFTDIATRIDLHDGIRLYSSVSNATGGATISWTEYLRVQDSVFQYKGTNIATISNGSSNRVVTSNNATNLNGESNLTFDGTTLQINNRLHMDGSSPFILIEESGVTNTPEFWFGVDGGNLSIRLNNSGTYPLQVITNTDNDAVDSVNLGYNTTVQGNVTLNGIVLDGNTITGVDDSNEFTNNDAHIMTSAAVEDKILSYGYTTNTGDITAVTAGTGLTGGSTSGGATLNVDYLPATDDRDVKPNAITTSGVKQVRAYFTTLEGLTGSSGSDYQDLLVLDTYSDGSGGDMNALAFDKSTQNIYHYLADQSDSTWGTAKRIAYIENGSNNRVMTASSSSTVNGEGNLTFDGTNLTVAHSSGAVIFAASHATDKIQLYSGGNEKIGTEANTIVFTADNYKFKDVAGTTNLTLDNNGVAYLTSHLDMGDGDRIKLGDSDDLQLVHTGGINYIHSTSSNTDLYIRVNDDGTDTDAIIIDSSDNAQVRLPNDNQYLTFGAGGDGVLYSYNDDFYVSNHTAGNDILLTCLNSAGDTHNTIMFVDGSAQRVGINTTSPATEFHVNASGANGMVLKASDNASNSARLFFDGTATSCIFQEGNDLSFRTGATTASSSGTERFFITSSGPKVPTGSQLYVDDIYGQSNGTNRLVLDDDTNSSVANGVSLTGVNHVYLCPDETNNGTGEVRVITGTDNDLDSGTADAVAKITNAGEAHFKGDVVAFSSSPSDRQLKENISTIENGLDKVMKLRGVEFDWTATSRKGQHDIGLIAQEVEEVLPEVVSVKTLRVGEFGRDGDEKDFKTVNYEKMVGVLVEAIKELKAEIEELKK